MNKIQVAVRLAKATLLAASGLVIADATPVAATTLDASTTTFQFGVTGQTVDSVANLDHPGFNPTPSGGGSPGTSITYRAVATINATVIDAVLTFVSAQNSRRPDDYHQMDAALGSSSTSPYITQQIDATTSAGVSAEFRVDFYEAGTYTTPGSGTPVTMSGLTVNFYDIDLRQVVEVTDVLAFSVSTNSHVMTTSPANGTLRFTSPPGSTNPGDGTAYTRGRAEVILVETSSFTYRLSAPAGASSLFETHISPGVAWTDNFGAAQVTMSASSFASIAPATQTITGVVNCPLLTQPLTAENFGGVFTYSTTSASLPAGLTLDATTGAISGIPTAVVSNQLVAINGNDDDGSGVATGVASTLVVFDITTAALSLTPDSQTVTGTVGTTITASTALTALAGCNATSYAITSGTLPAGLTFNPSTGVITGTPTEASTETITITATDALNQTATTTVTFSITGSAGTLPPALPGLINQPVPTSPPTTTAPSTTTPTSTTTAPSATTTPAPEPVPTGDTLVTENGQPVTVELVVENNEALVLRSQDFELRLRGACTTGCTITQDTTGRDTIQLERNGGARVSGNGFLPGSQVHVWIATDNQYLGALTVAPDGTYDGTFPLTDIEAGTHTLQANGYSADNLPRSANIGIVVVNNLAPTPGPTALPATGTTTNTTALWAALLALLAGTTLLSRRTRQSCGSGGTKRPPLQTPG